ncbi:unnamed protein product [Urochloa humidicola]
MDVTAHLEIIIFLPHAACVRLRAADDVIAGIFFHYLKTKLSMCKGCTDREVEAGQCNEDSRQQSLI